MKIPLLTSLTIAVLTTVGFASPPVEAELKALVHQTVEAFVKADVDFLEHALAEEAIIVNFDGSISPKGQVLSELKKDLAFLSLKMTEVKVRMLGENNALITGALKGAGKFKGEKKYDINTRDVLCYEKKDGNWRCIFWQGTEIRRADSADE